MRKEFIELINLGITSKANIPDLNDMTDRGYRPVKPAYLALNAPVFTLLIKRNPAKAGFSVANIA